MNLKTKRLIFDEISWEDIPEIHALLQHDEVDEFNTLGIPETIEHTMQIMRKLIEIDPNRRNTYTWKINSREDEKFIGLAGLKLSLDKYKLGEIFCKLHPSEWRKGYATEVSRRLISCGFDDFNLHKIEAGAATENKASIYVLEKIGMTKEGLRRKLLPIRGKWVDNYHFGILEDDPRDY